MNKSAHDLYSAYTKIYEQSSTDTMDGMLGRLDDFRNRAEKRIEANNQRVQNSPYSKSTSSNVQKQQDFARMAKPTNFTDRIRETIKRVYTDPIQEIKSKGGTPAEIDDRTYEKYKALKDKYLRYINQMLGLARDKDEREYRSRQDGTPSSEWNRDESGGLDTEQIENYAMYLYELDSAYLSGDTRALMVAIRSRGGDDLY